MGYKNNIFLVQKIIPTEILWENPTEAGFGHFQPENDSSIHLSPKNLDQALPNLLTLAVQHCTEHQSCPNQICQSSNSALVIGTPLFSGAHFVSHFDFGIAIKSEFTIQSSAVLSVKALNCYFGADAPHRISPAWIVLRVVSPAAFVKKLVPS